MSVSALQSQALVPAFGDWRTKTTAHFAFHYQAANIQMANRIAEIAERVHAKLEPKYRSGAVLTHVILVMDSDIVNSFATPYGQDLIFLYLEHPAPGDFSRYDLWAEILFTHEYTHILTLRYYDGTLLTALRIILGIPPNLISPPAFSEGYAVYEESQPGKGRLNDPLTNMTVRTAILEDRFPAPEEILSGTHRWPHGATYYLYGSRLVNYIHSKYPDGAKDFWRVDTPPLFINSKLGGAQIPAIRFLYSELEAQEKEKALAELEKLQAAGVTPFERLTNDGETKEHLTAGKTGLLYFARPGNRPPGYYRYIADSKGPPEYLRRVNSSAGVTESNEMLIGSEDYFSFPSWVGLRQELYNSKRNFWMKRIYPNSSAFDPAFSPDGSQIYFVEKTSKERMLRVADVIDGEIQNPRTLHSVPFTGILRFISVSPDGNSIVTVSRSGEKGTGSIVLCDTHAEKSCKSVVSGGGSKVRPVFSADGSELYFSSDADGIYNIYSLNVKTGRVKKRTRTLTGLFDPVADPTHLYALGYFGTGYDLVRMKYEELLSEDTDLFKAEGENDTAFFTPESDTGPNSTPEAARNSDPTYDGPFAIRPFFAGILSGTSLYSAAVGAFDPINWHNLFAGISAGTPDPYAYGFYDYSRFNPGISLFYSTNYWKRDRAPGCINPTDVFRFLCEDKYSFEEDAAGYFRYSDKRRNASYQILPGYVAYKLRNARQIRIAEYDARDLNLSGPALTFLAGRTDAYYESISPETGWRIFASGEYYTKETSRRELDPSMKSVIEYGVAEGGGALYLPSFWDHHVNYISAYGYTSLGPDREIQKVRLSRFQRGIAYDRSPKNYSADLFTYEYRFPILWSSRSPGSSTDIVIRSVSMSAFYEAGAAFDVLPYKKDYRSSAGLNFDLATTIFSLPLAPIRLTLAQGLGKEGEFQIYLSVHSDFSGTLDGGMLHSDRIIEPYHRALPRTREVPGYFRDPIAGGILE